MPFSKLFEFTLRKNRAPDGSRTRCDPGAIFTGVPSLNQRILGIGAPSALQFNVTGSWRGTVVSIGCSVIRGICKPVNEKQKCKYFYLKCEGKKVGTNRMKSEIKFYAFDSKNLKTENANESIENFTQKPETINAHTHTHTPMPSPWSASQSPSQTNTWIIKWSEKQQKKITTTAFLLLCLLFCV